jgi:hypothetical protein
MRKAMNDQQETHPDTKCDLPHFVYLFPWLGMIRVGEILMLANPRHPD